MTGPTASRHHYQSCFYSHSRSSSSATSTIERTFTYTLERATGEPEGEIKTVEGRDGMLQVIAYYDDDLRRLEPYGG